MAERTRGSEPSQYPKEEKTKVIPLVVASERGGWLNRTHEIPGRGCVCGVVGVIRLGSTWPRGSSVWLIEVAWDGLP